MIEKLIPLEAARIQHQLQIDKSKNRLERNKLGQFATPPSLSQEITQYARQLWESRSDKVRFLDPAIGTGSFYYGIIQSFPSSAIESAEGIEIDEYYAAVAKQLWADVGLKVTVADFTRLATPKSDRPNLIIANPPYVRHHHLNLMQKNHLRLISRKVIGKEVSGLTGLYCYFMLIAHEWLAEDGIGIWLIPAEFMDVNYGSALKEYLANKVTLIHLHRFNPADVQFDDALVSSAIVIFKRTLPTDEHAAMFSFGGSLQEPATANTVSLRQLRTERKWSSLSAVKYRDKESLVASHTLNAIFDIKRGIATGANGFFILKRNHAKSIGIDERFLRPVLPSPRYLKTDTIQACQDKYPMFDEQLVILDTDLPEWVIKEKCPALFEYLQIGKERGVDQGYLSLKRKPWYRQEQREAAPFLCTYMGRSNGNDAPFRFIRNLSAAIATNVYLMLYPKGILKDALLKDPSLYSRVFQLLKQLEKSSVLDESRIYGGGLHKVEPAELGRVSATQLVKELDLSGRPKNRLFDI